MCCEATLVFNECNLNTHELILNILTPLCTFFPLMRCRWVSWKRLPSEQASNCLIVHLVSVWTVIYLRCHFGAPDCCAIIRTRSLFSACIGDSLLKVCHWLLKEAHWKKKRKGMLTNRHNIISNSLCLQTNTCTDGVFIFLDMSRTGNLAMPWLGFIKLVCIGRALSLPRAIGT